LQFAGGFALLALLLLGVGGTIYKLISPEGWLAQLMGGGLGYGGAIMLALTAGMVVAWVTQDRISVTRRNLLADWWVYLFAGCGLLYLVEIALHGSL